MLSSVALTGVLFVEIPKSFFPQEDTGLIQGIAEGAENISPEGMKDRMRKREPDFSEKRFGYATFLQFVKAAYRRPFKQGEEKILDGGGRVTELMAKPLLNLFYPELAGFVQPLAGEFAARREVLSSVPFFTGYGVEIGMLIDVFDQVGLKAMAQVDLGTRQNRHQSLANLSRMSSVVLRTVAAREGLAQRLDRDLSNGVSGLWEQPDTYLHAVATEDGLRIDEHLNELVERPPLASLTDDTTLSTIV